VPVISIAGAITAAYMALITYLYMARPEFGILSVPSTAFLVGVYLLGIALYYAHKVYYRRRGIAVDLAFKEIPPE